MTTDYVAGVPLTAVIDSDESDLRTLCEMLTETGSGHIVGTAERAEEIPALMSAGPDILLLDAGDGSLDVEAIIRQVHEYSPRCQVILTMRGDVRLDPIKAMRVGVRGIVHKPVERTELVEVIRDVFVAELKRRSRTGSLATADGAQRGAGEVITVFSLKGGVGCTMIAGNLAIALANITKSKVALVDYSLQSGDIGVHLNLYLEHGVHELMPHIEYLDSAILEAVMVPHSSGVRVLLAPATIEQVEEVESDALVAVIMALRKDYDYVVVDTFHAVEDSSLAIIDHSDVLLVVTTPEVPALRATRRMLDVVEERPQVKGKIRLVVNRFPSRGAVSMRDVEESLGLTPTVTIPSDEQLVTTSINDGTPLIYKRSAASEMISKLASTLAQSRLDRQKRAEKSREWFRAAMMGARE